MQQDLHLTRLHHSISSCDEISQDPLSSLARHQQALSSILCSGEALAARAHPQPITAALYIPAQARAAAALCIISVHDDSVACPRPFRVHGCAVDIDPGHSTQWVLNCNNGSSSGTDEMDCRLRLYRPCKTERYMQYQYNTKNVRLSTLTMLGILGFEAGLFSEQTESQYRNMCIERHNLFLPWRFHTVPCRTYLLCSIPSPHAHAR